MVGPTTGEEMADVMAEETVLPWRDLSLFRILGRFLTTFWQRSAASTDNRYRRATPPIDCFLTPLGACAWRADDTKSSSAISPASSSSTSKLLSQFGMAQSGSTSITTGSPTGGANHGLGMVAAGGGGGGGGGIGSLRTLHCVLLSIMACRRACSARALACRRSSLKSSRLSSGFSAAVSGKIVGG